jgi:F420-dependent oxidoreductase-like protein
MKIGLQIPFFDWPGGVEKIGSTLIDIACTTDALGFSSLWVMDHFFQMEGYGPAKAEDRMLESYTTLGFMGAVTRQIRLGAMVTGVNYRPAGLLLKIVSTLDVLTNGRAWLGIGAGWYEREAHGLGLPYPPLTERFERLEETLQVLTQAWSGDISPFNGKHLQLAELINNPQPVSKPRPPILIGGGGEKKTLRLVAQYADACNLFAVGDNAALAQKLDILKQHCDEIGRDYNEIERTVLAPASFGQFNTPADIIERCRALSAIGVQHVILSGVVNVHEVGPLEVIGREVIPAVADL